MGLPCPMRCTHQAALFQQPSGSGADCHTSPRTQTCRSGALGHRHLILLVALHSCLGLLRGCLLLLFAAVVWDDRLGTTRGISPASGDGLGPPGCSLHGAVRQHSAAGVKRTAMLSCCRLAGALSAARHLLWRQQEFGRPSMPLLHRARVNGRQARQKWRLSSIMVCCSKLDGRPSRKQYVSQSLGCRLAARMAVGVLRLLPEAFLPLNKRTASLLTCGGALVDLAASAHADLTSARVPRRCLSLKRPLLPYCKQHS